MCGGGGEGGGAVVLPVHCAPSVGGLTGVCWTKSLLFTGPGVHSNTNSLTT